MGFFKAAQNDVGKVYSAYKGLGVVGSFFTFLQGRATAFAILFAAEGVVFVGVAIWGFFRGHDLTSLAAVVQSMAVLDGAIFTGVVGHSLKEDYFEMRRRQDPQNTTVVVDNNILNK